MILKRDNQSRMFHLSYDKKREEDGEKLKYQIVWSILNADMGARLSSHAESTILIESNRDYLDWEMLFNTSYRDRIYYIFSEVRQDEFNYWMDIEVNNTLNQPFIEKVEDIRSEILKYRSNIGL